MTDTTATLDAFRGTTERRGYNICHAGPSVNCRERDEFMDTPEFDTVEEVKAYIDRHRDELPKTARPGWFTRRQHGIMRWSSMSAVPEEHGGAPAPI